MLSPFYMQQDEAYGSYVSDLFFIGSVVGIDIYRGLNEKKRGNQKAASVIGYPSVSTSPATSPL